MVILARPEVGKLGDRDHFLLDRLPKGVGALGGSRVTVILRLNSLLVHMLGE